MIVIPPLPSKQVSGRFEDVFIEQRRRELETWLNRLATHPVTRGALVFRHFLSVDEGSKQWKEGKRAAEKDKIKAQYFYRNVEPTTPLPDAVDSIYELYKKSASLFDANVARFGKCSDLMVRNQQTYAESLMTWGKSVQAIGTAKGDTAFCWRPDCQTCNTMVTAFQHFGSATQDIRNLLSGADGVRSFDLIGSSISDYNGLIPLYQAAMKVRDTATNAYAGMQAKSVKVAKGLTEEEQRKLEGMLERCNVISAIGLAEMEMFHVGRTGDFRKHFLDFLNGQVRLHQQIGAIWAGLITQVEAFSDRVIA
jgi:sorting nexin-9/18/33